MFTTWAVATFASRRAPTVRLKILRNRLSPQLGVRFADGIKVVRSQAQAAAA